MKTILTTLHLCGLVLAAGCLQPLALQAQEQKSPALCTLGTARASVESGNVKTMLLNGGDMFWDLANPKFEVPKNSGKHSIFAGGIWFGGIEAGGSQMLHLADQTYRQAIGGPADAGFWPGPLDQNVAIDHTNCAAYDQVWHFTRQEINQHIANYNTPGYVVPANIANWPATGNAMHGNGSNVPFIDVNANGTYDPASGDYPDLLGDDVVYSIMNDVGGIKEPYTPAIGMETHIMMYGFDAPANPHINNTIFARYTFINRGSKLLADTYFAHWLDFDVGYYLDDLIGCDTTNNIFYCYNGDNLDEGLTGYGANPPAQGAMFLNVPLTNFTYFQNNSSPINGNPNEASDFYNYMKSRWGNGNPIYYGGDGVVGSTIIKHMFSGDPVAGTGWNEISVGNVPGDRRGVGSFGPFTFAPGQIIHFDMAYPWAQGSSNLNSITELRQAAQQVQTFYSTVLGTAEAIPGAQAPFLQLYPNPTTGSVTVQCTGTNADQATFTLRDLTGRTVLQAKAQLPAGEAQHQLNLERVPQGMYLLQVQRGEVSQTVRVVKQ